MTATHDRAAEDRPDTVPAPMRFDHGLLLRGAHLVGLLHSRRGMVRVGLAIAAVTWVPLALLALVDGAAAGGVLVPLRDSFGTHVRLLLSIPLFFFAEWLFTDRIGAVLRELYEKGLITPADEPRFSRVLRRAQGLWASWEVEAALVVVTVVSIYAGVRSDLPAGLTTWRGTADVGLTPAGWWYSLVSLPVFQFLVWRWAWRLAVWVWLLWQLSRIDLRLFPTHPDGAGGLGPLGVAHVDLSPLTFASSATLAASYAEQIKFGGVVLSEFAIPIAAIVVGLTAMCVLPLCFFSRRLLELKQQGLLTYGGFASDYVQAFNDKWVRGGTTGQPLLGTADLQSLADLGNSFGVIRNMRLVPISSPQIVTLGLAALLPMLPLVLFVVPAEEIVAGFVRSLLGL